LTLDPVLTTPLPPTPSTFPIITPDATQVAHWKEYQTELAKCILWYLCSYSHPENALCEWAVLGRSGQDVYVWAQCRSSDASGAEPAVIHLKIDGTIQTVEVPRYVTWDSDIQRMFPAELQEKINTYTNGYFHSRSGRVDELGRHLVWREEHPDQPPLIVLSATPAP